MKMTFDENSTASILQRLHQANKKFVGLNPGTTHDRQPVHTVYGGAQIFSSETAKKMSETALKNFKQYAPDAATLVKALGEQDSDSELWNKIYNRITKKLEDEAVEDFRIDYEDGYGTRPDAEEDGHAESGALEVAKGMAQNSLPPFIGIRIKPFSEECHRRSIRTLDIFLSTLLTKTSGLLPPHFVVTLPKVTHAEQCTALVQLFEAIEKKYKLPDNILKFEFMVETTQSIINHDGFSPLRGFAEAGKGRCTGAHFGTYDYTAGCGITAHYQTMINPVCDFAKHVMQVSLMGTSVWLSDGATNVMPVGPHRAKAGGALTAIQQQENQAVVHRAWKLSYDHIRHSLATGFYQGWDLHPAQLPIRYAATYAFFLESLQSASDRLKGFVEKAAQATLLGDVFDDAATGQGLLNFFLRALSCGAINSEEALKTGLSIKQIQSKKYF
ncbi:MAG: phosphoenolpyruvate kinase [Deltaproteobacteria bacterium]|nr:phosphoenolpyruvate kinase [Deltaproteobacteria bacterium]